MAKFDKNAYNLKYRHTHYKRYNIDFDVEKDKDVIEFLEALPNRKAFIIALIRKEIKGGN